MIIWIASYPKSGNTWIRALLSAYLYSREGFFDFNYLNKIDQFPQKKYFNRFPEIFDDAKKITKYWIAAQSDLNKKNKILFLKTHMSNCIIDNNAFTDKKNTLGVIYVVRDPRNVITSLANGFELSLDEAYDFFTNERKFLIPKNMKKSFTDASFIGSWKYHYSSWKNINFAPIKIVKYEDLISDTHNTFISILEFLKNFMKINIEKKKLINVLESCNFEVLRNKEKKEGFFESPISKNKNKKITFFHLGKKNNWKNTLDDSLEKKIRNVFLKEMRELSYF